MAAVDCRFGVACAAQAGIVCNDYIAPVVTAGRSMLRSSETSSRRFTQSKHKSFSHVISMFALIRTMSNRIGRFEYKGCRVEIFTAKKGMQWAWAFVVNGTEGKANGSQYCKTAALAVDTAKAEACRFIDRKR